MQKAIMSQVQRMIELSKIESENRDKAWELSFIKWKYWKVLSRLFENLFNQDCYLTIHRLKFSCQSCYWNHPNSLGTSSKKSFLKKTKKTAFTKGEKPKVEIFSSKCFG